MPIFKDKFLTGQLYGAVTYRPDRCISSFKILMGIEVGICQTSQQALQHSQHNEIVTFAICFLDMEHTWDLHG